MPNQETPITNPEKTKKADKQNRLSRNERTARDLQIELWETEADMLNAQDRIASGVIDEWNRGEEAWHDAHRRRNAMTESQRRGADWKRVDKEINNIRNGKGRKYKPEDLAISADILERKNTRTFVAIDKAGPNRNRKVDVPDSLSQFDQIQ